MLTCTTIILLSQQFVYMGHYTYTIILKVCSHVMIFCLFFLPTSRLKTYLVNTKITSQIKTLFQNSQAFYLLQTVQTRFVSLEWLKKSKIVSKSNGKSCEHQAICSIVAEILKYFMLDNHCCFHLKCSWHERKFQT